MHKRILLALPLALAMCSLSLFEVRSQTEGGKDDLAIKVADAQKANLDRLKPYRWRVKTDLQSGGVSKAKVVNEVGFDAEGKVKIDPISGETSVEKKPGFRGRQQEKAMSAEAEYLGKVLQQSFAYMYMSKGTLVDMFEKATIATEGADTKVTGKDVYVKGDQVVMILDATTMLTKKLTFTTKMGEDVINGDVTYAPLKDGTNRVTNSVIDVPAKTAKIVSESYDFVKPEN